MIFNETKIINLRDIFCMVVTKIFGDTETFLDFLEKGKYSTKYDCYVNYDEENYIINRETGEYINWYKLSHIGRCINISIIHLDKNIYLDKSIQKWIEEFLVEFKESEEDI